MLYSNDGSLSAEKITNLSIEMADIEPKVLAAKDLLAKQQAVQELEEVGIDIYSISIHTHRYLYMYI